MPEINCGFEIGEVVDVPEPMLKWDSWDFPFQGTIKKFKMDSDDRELAVVEDMDGNCWDVPLLNISPSK